jgi:hypothetical protein
LEELRWLKRVVNKIIGAVIPIGFYIKEKGKSTALQMTLSAA